MFLSIKPFTQPALLTWCTIFHSSTDKKLAATQDRQTMQNSDEKQYCHPYTAWQKILLCWYCTDKSLDVCIFARFEVDCEVMLQRSFAIFKLIMSRHRNELRGALGHGLFVLCVNPSLCVPLSYEAKAMVRMSEAMRSNSASHYTLSDNHKVNVYNADRLIWCVESNSPELKPIAISQSDV